MSSCKSKLDPKIVLSKAKELCRDIILGIQKNEIDWHDFNQIYFRFNSMKVGEYNDSHEGTEVKNVLLKTNDYTLLDTDWCKEFNRDICSISSHHEREGRTLMYANDTCAKCAEILTMNRNTIETKTENVDRDLNDIY